MPLQTSPQLLRTIGIEVETENLQSTGLDFDRGKGGWKFTHDASIESPVSYALVGNKNVLITDKTPLLNFIPYQNSQIGVEIVSGILDLEDTEFLKEIERLLFYIQEKGESPQSNRAGIHFHISMPQPSVTILRNILRYGEFFEALFFHIGGMGYQFRGLENDSTYCRPITKNGASYIPYRGRWAKCYSIKDLTVVQKTSLEKFWEMYGDCYNHDNRYTPIRYSWLNLFPMFPSHNGNYRGTLEFRVFNKTLNPYFVYNAARMCQAFAKLAVVSSLTTLKENNILGRVNSIFDPYDSKELLSTFKELTELDQSVFEGLTDIINSTPQPNLPEKKIKSHLLDRNNLNEYWASGEYIPETENGNDIFSPKYVTIHTLEEQRPPRRPERLIMEPDNFLHDIEVAIENATEDFSIECPLGKIGIVERYLINNGIRYERVTPSRFLVRIGAI